MAQLAGTQTLDAVAFRAWEYYIGPCQNKSDMNTTAWLVVGATSEGVEARQNRDARVGQDSRL